MNRIDWFLEHPNGDLRWDVLIDGQVAAWMVPTRDGSCNFRVLPPGEGELPSELQSKSAYVDLLESHRILIRNTFDGKSQLPSWAILREGPPYPIVDDRFAPNFLRPTRSERRAFKRMERFDLAYLHIRRVSRRRIEYCVARSSLIAPIIWDVVINGQVAGRLKPERNGNFYVQDWLMTEVSPSREFWERDATYCAEFLCEDLGCRFQDVLLWCVGDAVTCQSETFPYMCTLNFREKFLLHSGLYRLLELDTPRWIGQPF